MSCRRRSLAPGPGRDWRALTDAHQPQRLLSLGDASEAPESGAQDHETDDVDLRVQNVDGHLRVVLVAAMTWHDPAPLRRLAERLIEAADALNGRPS